MKKKWRFAIGTTSRVPRSGGLHYLIADIDGPLINTPTIQALRGHGHFIVQATQHGWHLYTNIKMNFDVLVKMVKKIGADPSWVSIGKERGYYFLADKAPIDFPWPVEHMVIHYGKKKT